MEINFADRCGILGEIWFQFRDDEDLRDLIRYNDVGLPLAWFIASGVVTSLSMAEEYVNETF